MEISSDFGERLREIRKAKGWTQAQLAQKLGVSATTINEYESSLSFPRLERFMALVQLLNTSADYLLGFKGEKSFDFSGLSDEQKSLLEATIEAFAVQFKKDNQR